MKYGIMRIPTVRIFKNERVLERVVAAVAYQVFRSKIDMVPNGR